MQSMRSQQDGGRGVFIFYPRGPNFLFALSALLLSATVGIRTDCSSALEQSKRNCKACQRAHVWTPRTFFNRAWKRRSKILKEVADSCSGRYEKAHEAL
jgi:hypothetical protein